MSVEHLKPYKADDFEKLFAKIDEATANQDHEALSRYRQTLKMYWDTNNIIETAYQEGLALRRKKYIEGVIERGRQMGIDDTLIAQFTGLTVEQVQNFLK